MLDSGGHPESEGAFGRFGLELTARVRLGYGETAEFTYGDGENIFTAYSADVDDFVYDIEFDCRCFTHEEQGDFHLVYEVIELPLPMGRKKVELVPDHADKHLVSPEVYCTGGTFP